MKVWGLIKREQKIINQRIYTADISAIEHALEYFCREFDIGRPILMDKHVRELRDFKRTVFKYDDFMENIDFDSFEIEIMSEKKRHDAEPSPLRDV